MSAERFRFKGSLTAILRDSDGNIKERREVEFDDSY